MSINVYCDSASLNEMREMALLPIVRGWTTNPSLMLRSGAVVSYEFWAREVCEEFSLYPISFEVIADEFRGMERQAKLIASWGENVYVKIPITNTLGQSSIDLIGSLSQDGIRVNVTAVLTYAQIDAVMGALADTPSIVSVFAGRIADTGRNPVATINHALRQRRILSTKILWASTRQVLDVYTADSIGCDIITCTPEIIKKLPLEGKSLKQHSLDTVKQFRSDALAAGYTL